jgi:nucleoside 2-deoxyribosyltransferase
LFTVSIPVKERMNDMIYPTKIVYLAGTITGLDYIEARYGWREKFGQLLLDHGLTHVLPNSPMRGKEFLVDIGALSGTGEGYPENAMATDAGITTRDLNDVRNCDLMVACFLESGGRLSGGTMIEYGFAAAFGKPIVAVGPPDDPNIAHVMARRMAGYRVGSLEEAIPLVAHLLTPGV